MMFNLIIIMISKNRMKMMIFPITIFLMATRITHTTKIITKKRISMNISTKTNMKMTEIIFRMFMKTKIYPRV